jgi:hypothetical protein
VMLIAFIATTIAEHAPSVAKVFAGISVCTAFGFLLRCPGAPTGGR